MSLKLLVIDDSSNTQRVVGLAFSDEDAIVESVSDGEIALDIVRDFRPDVILADVFMPGYSGYDICAHIKDDPELSDTAVVLLAGALEPYDELEASRAKCDGFLTKPFNTSDLLETVHTLAQKRQLQRKAESETESDRIADRRATGGDRESDSFRLHSRISSDVRASFLGSDRILDVFDNDQLSIAQACMAASVQRNDLRTAGAAALAGPAAALDVVFSENTLNRIVDSVMRRMSAEAIREVAWEVVPELSESIIRRTIEEQDKA
ncbi:MAG TPA: response regulator [Acidobacteriota bacterium]|nr:response regulator [Acidobacteriota bacterium]